MNFLIADSFTDSLARLTGDEQRAVKTTAFDLQMNLANPGMSFHRIDRAKDKNFWSVRVNQDIRIIVHKTAGSLMLCYVDHHDDAYAWAERRRLETHPKTGAAQLVEIRETVREVVVPVYSPAVAQEKPGPQLLFEGISEEELLGYGVPQEWIPDVRSATEDTYLTIAEHLPAEAAEALLEIATGGKPQLTEHGPVSDPFEHPDAKRRFRVLANVEELEQALEFPWEKWTIFLHPSQREWVERSYSGPARVSGTAGTGKTIVALHRAAYLARTNPDSRVLLTTFSDALANALRTKLNRLLRSQPQLAEQIEVHSLSSLGTRLHRAQIGPVATADRSLILELLRAAADATETPHRYSLHFLASEWDQIVDAWQLQTWEEYRDVPRLGRKTRLPERQREVLWGIFSRVRSELVARRVKTEAAIFTDLAKTVEESKRPPFDFAVVDEAQDLGVPHLRFFAALGAERPDALFFAGDLGQRIFQQAFSWKSLGVDIRGRSRNLRVNYRTSHQIRIQADRLLGPEVADVDGNTESRSDTISVFNGPIPEIRTFPDHPGEIEFVATWIRKLRDKGVSPEEFGIFVRSENELGRAREAVEKSGVPFKILEERALNAGAAASVSTMHLAKGLEVRAVAVMGCDDEVLPWQERIEAVSDESDLNEVYVTERHLLYVACTRARDHLLVTAVEPASEFLDDMCSEGLK